MFKSVQVETTTYCNATCQFCPHDKMKSFALMDEALYQKIVLDASQYDLARFIPMLSGEPFTDPQIIERIEFAREHLKPSTQIRLFTNGSLITREQIDRLATIRNFKLSVSLNGPNREIRKEMMGLDDWDEVVAKICYIRVKGILLQNTTVNFPSISNKELNTLMPIPLSGVVAFANWCGEIYPYNRIRPTNCERVKEELSITVNGDANLCCFDMFNKVVFGNLKDKTLKEIWDIPGRQKYLEMHSLNRGQELPMCNHCT